MTTGQNIRAARRAAGLTQKQLSQKIGCTQSRITDWERDLYIPKPAPLKLLSEALGVPADRLISLDEPIPEKKRATYNDILYGYKCLGYCIIEENRVSYIQALRKLEKHPNNREAMQEALRCEDFFLNDFPGLIEEDIDGEAAISAMRQFAKGKDKIRKKKFEPAQRKKYDMGNVFEFWR